MNNLLDLKYDLPADLDLPGDFFDQVTADKNCCIFLLSCTGDHRYLHLGSSAEALTGYSSAQFAKGGIDFWFSLIHPKDLTKVSESIFAKFKDLVNIHFRMEKPSPLILRYRFRHRNGQLIWLRDTRYLLNVNSHGQPQKVLRKMEVIAEAAGNETEFDQLLGNEETLPDLLKGAWELKNGTGPGLSVLTKREKEILLLIGDGLSTKMIADQCCISINTVETHRKHLLEKLNARNSMELVKQASKIFWL